MKRLVGILLLVFAAGCARFTDDSANGALFLTGRVSVVYPGDGFTGRFTWRTRPATEDILIQTPMGSGVARILLTPDEAQLLLPDGRHWQAADAETLTRKVLGWPLPAASINDLIHGEIRPVDRMDHGWHLHATTLTMDNHPYWKRIDLERDRIHVHLLVDPPGGGI